MKRYSQMVGLLGALAVLLLSCSDGGDHSASASVSGNAYVAHSRGISQLSFRSGGDLVSIATITIPEEEGNVSSVALHPSGKYAYAGDMFGFVRQYSVGTGGELKAMSTATVPAVSPDPGQGPVTIAVEPSGRYAYMTNNGSDSVSQYAIDSNGALSSLPTPTVATGRNPQCIVIHPSGKYAYVANSDNNLSQYTIGNDGGLVAMSTPTVATGDGPGCPIVSPSGEYVYTPNSSDSIIQYNVTADGSLSLAKIESVSCPDVIIADPHGNYLYVATCLENIVGFSIGTDGSLTSLTTPDAATGPNPVSLAIDPSSTYLYAANFSGGSISQFTIGADGGLISLSTATIVVEAYPIDIQVAVHQ